MHTAIARRVAGAFLVVGLTVAGTVWLEDYFLRAPIGALIYLPAAAMLDLFGFSLAAVSLLSWRYLTARVGQGAMVLSVLSVIVFSAASVWYVPFVAERALDSIYHSDPIGAGDDVARGPCSTRSLKRTSNARGLLAEVRETLCLGNWDGDRMYFVFVHGPKGLDNKATLVFRYSADTLPSTRPPTAVWRSPKRLMISGGSNVFDVTYQLPEKEGISIEYRPSL